MKKSAGAKASPAMRLVMSPRWDTTKIQDHLAQSLAAIMPMIMDLSNAHQVKCFHQAQDKPYGLELRWSRRDGKPFTRLGAKRMSDLMQGLLLKTDNMFIHMVDTKDNKIFTVVFRINSYKPFALRQESCIEKGDMREPIFHNLTR